MHIDPNRKWPLKASEIEAEVVKEVGGLALVYKPGDRVFAEKHEDGTYALRPPMRLGPTLICVPEEAIRAI